jgi:hypothetical protein
MTTGEGVCTQHGPFYGYCKVCDVDVESVRLQNAKASARSAALEDAAKECEAVAECSATALGAIGADECARRIRALKAVEP